MEQNRQIAIGVDIGGTFTDVILVDERAGSVYSAKVLTTPERPAQAVLTAVAQVLAYVYQLKLHQSGNAPEPKSMADPEVPAEYRRD